MAADITSVSITLFNFTELTYPKAYDPELYFLPNDNKEQHRLNIQHQIFRLSIDGPLTLAPTPKGNFRVLEIGAGTGIVSYSRLKYCISY
jgi:hypothetical protein